MARLVYGNPDEVKGNTPAGFLSQVPFESLVMDEIHNAKSRKRKKWTVTETGRWSGTSLDNRVAAAEFLSRKATRRLGTTGTPIPDRVRDYGGNLTLWSHRRGVGTGAGPSVTVRAARVSTAGWRTAVRAGCPNSKSVCTGCVTACLSRCRTASCPRSAARCSTLHPTDCLARPQERAVKLKTAPDAETRLEAMLRLACSRKRREIVEQTIDAVRGGSKVVIFTGRRADCDALHKSLTHKLKDHRVWIAHGGYSMVERDVSRTEYMAEQSGL